jgi:hypothetical protein
MNVSFNECSQCSQDPFIGLGGACTVVEQLSKHHIKGLAIQQYSNEIGDFHTLKQPCKTWSRPNHESIDSGSQVILRGNPSLKEIAKNDWQFYVTMINNITFSILVGLLDPCSRTLKPLSCDVKAILLTFKFVRVCDSNSEYNDLNSLQLVLPNKTPQVSHLMRGHNARPARLLP